MANHKHIELLYKINPHGDISDYIGVGSDFVVEECDWYFARVNPKIFLNNPCCMSPDQGVRVKTLEWWKLWWQRELCEEENGPGLRDIQSLETNWLKPENVEKHELTLTLWGTQISIEDGWHRAAVSVIHGLPAVYANLGIVRASAL